MIKQYSDTQITIRTLLRGETRARNTDKRRLLSNERCRLMTAVAEYRRGIRSAVDLAAATTEARRVYEMWATVA